MTTPQPRENTTQRFAEKTHTDPDPAVSLAGAPVSAWDRLKDALREPAGETQQERDEHKRYILSIDTEIELGSMERELARAEQTVLDVKARQVATAGRVLTTAAAVEFPDAEYVALDWSSSRDGHEGWKLGGVIGGEGVPLGTIEGPGVDAALTLIPHYHDAPKDLPWLTTSFKEAAVWLDHS